ncbi:MAG: hypothetical protein NDI82_13985 [Anaeromyxobacteraceae bacterium]|nr:hypothetical protein [Anaeromyxobacteraceae bacterium]
MTRFVLDTDVLISLEMTSAGLGLAARSKVPVVVTDVVWEELTAPGDPYARAQAFTKALAGEVTELEAGSPAAATLVALQQGPKTEGPGEHSVIAFCFHDSEAVAVLQDKGGIRRGVEELRGRVISFMGFLGVLVERGILTWPEAHTVAARYRRQYNHARVPAWWPPEQ